MKTISRIILTTATATTKAKNNYCLKTQRNFGCVFVFCNLRKILFKNQFDFFIILSYNKFDMEDIKQIIAKNLIALRKKNNLTQNELAEKLNYSDNAVSRWEHAEVTPSLETLQQIANIYGVPMRTIIEDNALREAEFSDKRQLVNKLAIVLIISSLVWVVATIIFVCSQLIWDYAFWQIFIWAMPIIALVMLPFHRYWGRHIYKFIILTIFTWTLLGAIFLQFFHLTNWLWMIFIVGVPIEIAFAVWAFVKPKPAKPKKAKVQKQSKAEKLSIKEEKRSLKQKYKSEKKKIKKQKESN